MADKYIVSNISMFSRNNKIYLYDSAGDALKLDECSYEDAAEKIAYYCLDNDVEFV